MEGITIIESSLGMRQGGAIRGPLFALAHYRVFLETILTQLALVGIKIKVSKCKLWSP